MRNAHCRTWNKTRKLKDVEMIIALCRTWNMARKLKTMENEKYTL
jgi:hypothetical protein